MLGEELLNDGLHLGDARRVILALDGEADLFLLEAVEDIGLRDRVQTFVVDFADRGLFTDINVEDDAALGIVFALDADVFEVPGVPEGVEIALDGGGVEGLAFMAEEAGDDRFLGNAAVADDANLGNRLLLCPCRKDGEAKKNEGQWLQRAAEYTARILACFDWRAHALSHDGKNRHTLTAKNQMKLEEKAIISDRRRSSQLRSVFASLAGHRGMLIPVQRLEEALLAFQFSMNIETFIIPDDSEKVWFATDLTILDIGLLSAG